MNKTKSGVPVLPETESFCMFENSSYSVQKQFVNFVGLEEAENGCLLTFNANCKLENYSYSETVLKSVIIICVSIPLQNT